MLCNAIEHVQDPRSLLVHVRDWLDTDGRVHIVVPNGHSLHRLVGVELGFLPQPLHLSDGDVAQGHLRNYTVDSLLAEVRGAGLRTTNLQPVFLKILSNPQMLSWEWALIEAIHTVAQRFPEHGAEIYAVAEPRDGHPAARCRWERGRERDRRAPSRRTAPTGSSEPTPPT